MGEAGGLSRSSQRVRRCPATVTLTISEARTPAFDLLAFSLVDREAGLLEPDSSHFFASGSAPKPPAQFGRVNSFPSGLSSKEAVI